MMSCCNVTPCIRKFSTRWDKDRNRMNIKVAIFDWDGTLVDSVEHITDSLHKAAAALGFPILEKAAYRNIIGLGMEEALNALYPGTPAEKIQDIRRAYSDFFFS